MLDGVKFSGLLAELELSDLKDREIQSIFRVQDGRRFGEVIKWTAEGSKVSISSVDKRGVMTGGCALMLVSGEWNAAMSYSKQGLLDGFMFVYSPEGKLRDVILCDHGKRVGRIGLVNLETNEAISSPGVVGGGIESKPKIDDTGSPFPFPGVMPEPESGSGE